MSGSAAGFLARNFRAFLPGFRKADGNRLFAALYLATLTTLSRFKRAALPAAHGTLNPLAGSFPVLSRHSPISLEVRCHKRKSDVAEGVLASRDGAANEFEMIDDMASAW
jgi:hypothetical protein